MTRHPKLQELLDRYHRGDCRPDEILLLILSLEIHMSAQLDALGTTLGSAVTTLGTVATQVAAIQAAGQQEDFGAVQAQANTLLTGLQALATSTAPPAPVAAPNP